MKRVPFIDLGPYVELVRQGSSFVQDVDVMLTEHEFIGGGPTTQKFETKLAAKLGANYAIACANGTDALQLALRAAGIHQGHRVAIPNLTFWATYEAVVNVGATPVILDIDPTDLQLSFSEFTFAHNRRHFDAAILVHLYGWCSKTLAEFRSFCRERRITLVEDGAQAFGVKYDDKSVFADADVITLSFHPAKVIGAVGDGGAVLCKTPRLAARIRALANHGRSGHYTHATVGWNSRMDAIQAAWLLRALEVSDQVIADRRRITRTFYEANIDPRVLGNGYLDIRSALPAAQARIRERGVDIRQIYPCTIADQSGADGAITVGPLATSRTFVERVMSLPLWYGMSDEDASYCARVWQEETSR